MEIIMFLCKSLNVLALIFITLIFIFKIYGKVPDDTTKFNQYLRNNAVSSSTHYVACDKNLLTMTSGESTTCFTVDAGTIVDGAEVNFTVLTKKS